MPKYYYKKKYYYRGSRDKYSVEQTVGSATTAAEGATTSQTIVPPATFQGMRKVKHLTISMGTGGAGSGSMLLWALVYVPEGTVPGALNYVSGGASVLYNPNQFVMGCGIFDFDAGPQRVHCPLSRNLNSGDQIMLLVRGLDSVGINYTYVVRYAITLQ